MKENAKDKLYFSNNFEWLGAKKDVNWCIKRNNFLNKISTTLIIIIFQSHITHIIVQNQCTGQCDKENVGVASLFQRIQIGGCHADGKGSTKDCMKGLPHISIKL